MVNHDTGAERDVPAEIERLTNGPRSEVLVVSDHPFFDKIDTAALTGEEPVGREFYSESARGANGVGEYVRVTRLDRAGQELFEAIGLEVPRYTIEVALMGPPPGPGMADHFVSTTLHLDSLCQLYGVASAQNYPEIEDAPAIALHDLRMHDWGLEITRTPDESGVLVNVIISTSCHRRIGASLSVLA